MKFLLSICIVLSLFGGVFCCASMTYAQESLALSITPPLFQVNVAPGEVWNSAIKVVNTNKYDLTVYAQLYNFEAKGEDGQGDIAPRTPHEEGDPGTLADWITVTTDPIVVPSEQSIEVPITVSIPQNAAPGGHFAAMLVGTRPPIENAGASVVRTSQVVTSLFFIRVAGDIHEQGMVREFSTAHTFVETPEADFSVRFQNNGNVHLQPQGGITIYNMWGKERGFIPINRQSHFGNVLPNSVRKFDFAWRGESSLSDIGRYSAEVSLVFGQEGRQTTTSKLYFWVIPIKAGLIVLGILASVISFFVWITRRYIRRAMYLAGYDAREAQEELGRRKKKKTLTLPLQEGVLDLRRRIKESDTKKSLFSSLVGFFKTYRLFFIAILGIVCVALIAAFYFMDVLKKQKKYEVTVERGDTGVVLSGEEVMREKLQNENSESAPSAQNFDIILINSTDVPGVAATGAHILEESGYTVSKVAHEPDIVETESVVYYTAGLEEKAKEISTKMGGIKITPEASATGFTGIRIILTSEIKSE